MQKSIISKEDLFIVLKVFAVTFLVIAAVLTGFSMYRLSVEYQLTLWICLIPSVLILLLIPVIFLKCRLPYILAWCILSAVLAVPGGICLYGEYTTATTLDTDPPFDTTPYLPFQTLENSSYRNVWRLNFWDDHQPLELELKDDLPVLDGAGLAFPIYSGIVNALYPETTQLNDEHFRYSGSDEAFLGLVDGDVDIYFGPAPTQAQISEAENKGVELVMTPIAYTYGRFIVQEENPVRTLTETQLRDIFSGKITNWSEVGGNDQPIQVYQNDPGSLAQRLLEQFMGETDLMEPAMETSFDFVNGLQEHTAKYRMDSGSIGFYVSGSGVTMPKSTRRLIIQPEDPENGKYGEYMVEAVVYAVTRKDAENESIGTILDFISSPEGQYMVMWAGYDPYLYGWDDGSQDDAPVVDTAPNIVLSDYMPFDKDSNIVRLDHEASLRLTEKLPRVDGAAAVFPVYSAFVNAVYPGGTRLYNNDTQDRETLPDHFFFNYSNTVKGYKYLAQKDIDIFFGGYPSDEQIAYAREQGTEFVYTPIGHDAFVFFVHKDNPIDSLTTEQIKAIYSGQITNWSQVGGLDEEIVAYQRNEGSGSQSRLIRFMDGTPLMEPPEDVRIDTMMGITESVAQYRSSTASIGFSFRYYMEALVANPDIKLLAIDGIAPTVENIQNGTYPEIGYLYAVTWEGNENENVQKLLDWVLSEEGQYIIEKTGYTPIY